MWKCPKCGRELAKTNQNHACSGVISTVDEYIAAQPEAIRPLLAQVRSAIRAALPGVEERLSWRMPTYWHRRNIIHFAAAQKHIGLYPGDKAIEHFQEQLAGYKTSKGAVQFRYDQPLPLELIGEIAKWCYDNVQHRYR